MVLVRSCFLLRTRTLHALRMELSNAAEDGCFDIFEDGV